MRYGPVAQYGLRHRPAKHETSNYFNDFSKFCVTNLALVEITIKSHKTQYNIISKFVKPEIASYNQIQDIIFNRKKEGKTTANLIKFVRVYYGKFLGLDWALSFKVPQQNNYSLRFVPSKEQLRTFFDALPYDMAKTTFLLLASSGLRISELLSSKIDFGNNMLIPLKHEGKTKHAFLSFFNNEAKEYLIKSGLRENIPKRTVQNWFLKAYRNTNIKIKPQHLREWFCSEMGRIGVPDRYVDAFCGRVPNSVLARHYTDFSPERLKEIYEKAELKILSYRKG